MAQGSSCEEEYLLVNINTRLPPEILDLILSYLDIKTRIRLELTCKLWKSLPWTWPKRLRIDVVKDPDKTHNIFDAILSRCGKGVRVLELRYFDNTLGYEAASESALDIVSQHCPNVEEMHMWGIHLSELSLENLSKGCHQLRVLRLRGNYQEISDVGLKCLFKSCKTLECLDLDTFPFQVTWDCLNGLNKNLQVFHLSLCGNVTTALESITKKCCALSELCVTYCEVNPGSLKKCFHKFRKTLKFLHLESVAVKLMRSPAFRAVVIPLRVNREGLQVLGNLEVLTLWAVSVSDELLKILAQNCVKLRAIRLLARSDTHRHYTFNFTDEGLGYLSALPFLKVLDISHINGLDGAGLEVVASQGQLEVVICRSTSVREESLIKLSSLCPNLRTLDVKQNGQISHKVIDAFCEAHKVGFIKDPVRLSVDSEITLGSYEGVELNPFDTKKTFQFDQLLAL